MVWVFGILFVEVIFRFMLKILKCSFAKSCCFTSKSNPTQNRLFNHSNQVVALKMNLLWIRPTSSTAENKIVPGQRFSRGQQWIAPALALKFNYTAQGWARRVANRENAPARQRKTAPIHGHDSHHSWMTNGSRSRSARGGPLKVMLQQGKCCTWWLQKAHPLSAKTVLELRKLRKGKMGSIGKFSTIIEIFKNLMSF